MNRHSSGPALVLRVRASGGADREAVFLTPDEGIVRATVYGGPKSRLRAYVAPFQSGTLYLYGAGRGARKVSDFDVSDWRPELREHLERSMTALAVCDALIAGSGGGAETAAAFALACDSLDALRSAGGAACGRVHLVFLRRWLDILGLLPEIFHNNGSGCDDGEARFAAPLLPLSRAPDLAARDAGSLPLSEAEAAEARRALLALLGEGTGRRAGGAGGGAW